MPSLAMHMANELLNLPVAGVTILLAAAAVAVSAGKSRTSLTGDKLPLTGVMGAFVFAAQMINFTLPGMPGTSGHLGGGVLLAILLGPAAGIVAMAAILIVQCLLFQDGGLLAIGCNIINIGVVPCLAGWGLYRLILGRPARAPAWRQYAAAWVACMVGVTAGAALVPLQAGVSDVLQVPVKDFLAVMVGVHLVIGLIEGAITFAVLGYLRSVRPQAVGLEASVRSQGRSRAAMSASLVVTAAMLAGVGSWFASTHEDGLEASIGRTYGQTQGAVKDEPSPALADVTALQAKWSLMPDYTRRQAPLGQMPPQQDDGEHAAAWPAVDGWGSLAGLAGTAVTLGIVYLVSLGLRRRRAAPVAKG